MLRTTRCSAAAGRHWPMHSTVRRTPSARETSSRRWPESTRQNRPPRAALSAIHCFSFSTSAARATGSGWVKSGEAHIMGTARSASSRRRLTKPTYSGSRLSKKAGYISIPSTSRVAARSIHSNRLIVRVTHSASRKHFGKTLRRGIGASGLQHGLDVAAAAHALEALPPAVEGGDAADDRAQVDPALGEEPDHLLPVLERMREAALQRHRLLHERVEREAERLGSPTYLGDLAPRPDDLQRLLQRDRSAGGIHDEVGPEAVAEAADEGGKVARLDLDG